MLLGSACDYFELMLSYLRLPPPHMVPWETGGWAAEAGQRTDRTKEAEYNKNTQQGTACFPWYVIRNLLQTSQNFAFLHIKKASATTHFDKQNSRNFLFSLFVTSVVIGLFCNVSCLLLLKLQFVQRNKGTPLIPVERYSPLAWVKGQGARVLHTACNQGGPHFSIQLGHLNLVQVTVNPVKVSSNPIHCQPLRSGQTMLNHHFNTGDTCNHT